MKKRLIAFLLVLIMVLGMLPVSAMAANSVYKDSNPEVTYTLNYYP